MEKTKHRIFAKGFWMIFLYAMVLVLMLAFSLTMLFSQSASAADRDQTLDRCGVTIQYHGQTTMATSSGETVRQLLQRLEMEVTGEDVVSHGMEDTVTDGMRLRIDRIVTTEECYTSVVSHSVTRCHDPQLPEGEEQVLIPGMDGELLCKAEVTYKNGWEITRKVISQTMTQPPVTEVVAVGTGEPEQGLQIGDGYIILPTGEVLTYTDTATVRATAYTHTDEGCDFITSTGTTVRWGTVAVDPRYIPYGTRMFIQASSGSYVYGIAVAEDCGGDIKGDRMDLYMPTYEQCMEFGRRVCTVYFLG